MMGTVYIAKVEAVDEEDEDSQEKISSADSTADSLENLGALIQTSGGKPAGEVPAEASGQPEEVPA